MTAAPNDSRPPIRWGLGFAYAAAAFVVVVVVFIGLAWWLDMHHGLRELGRATAKLGVWVAAGTLGAFALAQTGRRIAAALVTMLLVASVAGAAYWFASQVLGVDDALAQALPSDDLERADGVLRHPSLGFSIPDPGPGLVPQPWLVERMIDATPGSRTWVYGDQEQGELVIIMVMAGAGERERSFASVFAGMMDAMTERAEEGLAPERHERWLHWSDRRAHAYWVMEGLHMRFDAFALPSGHALVVNSTATNAERFATLPDGIEVPDARS